MSQVCDRPGQVCGGTGHVKRANAEVQKMCDEVAIAFSTQAVAGTNYFIKVQVGEKDYIHLCVFRSLLSDGYKLSLNKIQTSKSSQDPIEYF
ncbi:hypothetical protein Q7C36_022343 [Tachysurus vachellii]|uniref:Cystatin domain-containing protein n=1 Tax=Tachysurus vachellii TaxID=175792 RepID=A0AA88IGL4_TACVA|nr:hypothetical protein Q7C36_022343 [Tachysurus vachellii]